MLEEVEGRVKLVLAALSLAWFACAATQSPHSRGQLETYLGRHIVVAVVAVAVAVAVALVFAAAVVVVVAQVT